jgi:hypothetical protein
VSALVEALAAELERPRELSARVVNYIGGTYETELDTLGAFLVDKLPQLEEYEIDLILSPVFTPRLSDQVIFADMLGSDSVPRDQWPDLVQDLVARPTRARLVTPDGQVHAVALHPVTIERYLYRLRLDGTITPAVLQLIRSVPDAADQPVVKAIARRATWESGGVGAILVRYLSNALKQNVYNLPDAIDLLTLVEGRKPSSLDDLLERLPAWQKALREQIDTGSGGKPFFSEDVQRMHGGDRDQRVGEDARMSAKERELDFLLRLQRILAA